MEFIPARLKGAYIIIPRVYQDSRGFFLESYKKNVFEEQGIAINFVQDNHSYSVKKGILRGLHFQYPPHAQAKLVQVTRGKAWDVIVDLRKDSPTYLKWEGFEISAENFHMLLVPHGFAHGFLTLEENTELQYKCDDFYAPESEGGIIWNDPDLKIDWPIENPILLDRDANWPLLKDIADKF